MNLIDLSYFQGELYIGQSSQEYVQDNLNWFIDKYEPVYLKEVLKDKVSEIDLSSNEVSKKAISYYIYYHYVRNEYFQRAGIGETKPNAENATVVAPNYRSVYAWNEMVKLTIDWVKELGDSSIENPFEFENTLEI